MWIKEGRQKEKCLVTNQITAFAEARSWIGKVWYRKNDEKKERTTGFVLFLLNGGKRGGGGKTIKERERMLISLLFLKGGGRRGTVGLVSLFTKAGEGGVGCRGAGGSPRLTKNYRR